MSPQKVNYCGVERLGGLDVDSTPGVGPDYPKYRDRVPGEGSVRHKARFTLAIDQERRYPQVFDPFTHGDIGCCIAQGAGNATGCVELRIRQQLGMDVWREPSGMARMHTDAFECCVTVALDLLRLLHAARATRLDPLCIR